MNTKPNASNLIDLDEVADLLRSREGPPAATPSRRRSSLRTLIIALSSLAVAAAGLVFAVNTLEHHGKQDLPASISGIGRAICAAEIEWRGETYLGERVSQPFVLSDALGEGTLPACNDGVNSSVAPQPISVVAIADISSDVAIAVASEPRMMYVSPGYFPQLPGTALHDAIYGSRTDTPDERGDDCAGAATADLRAKVLSANFGILSVELDETAGLPQKVMIFPDAQTVVVAANEQIPHVRTGDVIQARILVCRHADDPHFLKLVATRLTIG